MTKNKKAASFAGRKHNEESEEEDLNEYSEATDDDNKKVRKGRDIYSDKTQ